MNGQQGVMVVRGDLIYKDKQHMIQDHAKLCLSYVITELIQKYWF